MKDYKSEIINKLYDISSIKKKRVNLKELGKK
jgi:hypothetical protein